MSSSDRSPGFLSDRDDFLALSEEEREERTNAMRALQYARQWHTTIETSAVRVGTDTDTVRWWVSEALHPTGPSGTYPTAHDDLLRVRPLGVDGCVDLVTVYGDQQADDADLVFRIQYDWAKGRHGDETLALLPDRFAGRRVVKDPYELHELAREGQFNIPEIYRFVVGS